MPLTNVQIIVKLWALYVEFFFRTDPIRSFYMYNNLNKEAK